MFFVYVTSFLPVINWHINLMILDTYKMLHFMVAHNTLSKYSLKGLPLSTFHRSGLRQTRTVDISNRLCANLMRSPGLDQSPAQQETCVFWTDVLMTVGIAQCNICPWLLCIYKLWLLVLTLWSGQEGETLWGSGLQGSNLRCNS